jgi:rubrerythrin
VPTESVERVLEEAFDDEDRARATYRAVIETFGDVRPFSNIVESEERHIQALTRLCRQHGLPVPEDRWAGRVTPPASLRDACEAGVAAERENAALYDRLIEAARAHPDVVAVLRQLRSASPENHLPAFERGLAREQRPGGGGRGPGRGRGRARQRRS